MRVTLVYHHAAGQGLSAGWLRQELERAGHQVVRVLDGPACLASADLSAIDLVVAAGGDGTIARTATALAGRDLPLAILPLGTANNIARSLGIDGTTAELIAAWPDAQPRPLDLGVARGGFGAAAFAEGIGGGFIPRSIALFDIDAPEIGEPPPDRVRRALSRYREVLAKLRPRCWTLTVDGTSLTGDYLLVEVLNIRSVGANVVLAPTADASDGWLDVVTVADDQRAALDDHLAALLAGTSATLTLPTRRAARVDTEGWTDMHIDDRLLAGTEIEAVSIEVQPAALRYLA
ncbi:MAG TPA: diacylglycerol kinase family protein [Kofleriaceae bacterium]|nr:diacylglycerol kinase family protein [Kofleriaceae bacterium]